MRKFFSLIAAVLFAGSMMAQVTILPTDFTATTSADYSVTKDGVTVAVTASTVTNDQMRIFKNQSITISAESNISSIEFTCTANGTAKYGPGCFAAQDGYTYEASGKKGTWVGSATSVTFTASSDQVRASQIVVTLEGGDPTPADTYTVAGSDAAIFGTEWDAANTANDMVLASGIYKWEKAELELTAGSIEFKVVKNHDWDIAYPSSNYVLNIAEDGEYTITITFNPSTEAVAAEAVKKVAPTAPATCAEAREAIMALADGAYLLDQAEITLQGYVTEIVTPYSDQYHNISFWMADAADGGQVIQAYRAACASAADAPNVGDKVEVVGKMKKYVKNSVATPEFDAACTLSIIERATFNDTYTVAGSDAAIFGTAWDAENTANDMVLESGIYKWEKAGLNLTAGMIEFKVVKNHDWNTAYPANNYELAIAEDGEYTITITFNPSTQAVAAEAVKQLPAPTNCAEAREAALSVSANNELYNNGAVYSIRGYVTGIKTAYSEDYHNISFWMADAVDGGEVLQAYRAACASEADAPQVGDIVEVTGTLTKYGTTPEFSAGCTFTITVHTAINNTNIDAQVVKFFENGQLFINKNGVIYNAQGAVVR